MKRQSIASRLHDKLKELKSSSEKRYASRSREFGSSGARYGNDVVTESMFSRVSDHESIIRKLDYKNQDHLTLQTPKKINSVSKSIAKFEKNMPHSDSEEEDDDKIKYQIELSF